MSPELENWKEKGHYFTYNDYAVFYRREGKGIPLLLIHGFPTAGWDWHCLWDELTKQHQVIAPDMIGFGFSDKPSGYPYHIIDQAALHEALLDLLGIDECHILAHDYGVSVAQELLARQVERLDSGAKGIRIRSICFLNGGLFPETHHPLRIQKLLLSPLGPLISNLSTERIARNRFFQVFGPETKPTEKEWADFWALTSYNQGKRILYRLIRYMIDRRENRERWVLPMQNSPIPLRLINGTEDPVSGRHLADRYRELIPNADIVLLEGIGHYPQVESPDAVLAGYRAFLAGIQD